MGSLEGHILPGTIFLCYGMWWTYALFDRYFKCLTQRLRFRCTANYSIAEEWIKVVATILGIIAEFYTALDSDLKFTHIGNSQHISMYLFFLINGITNILLQYGYPLPKDSDYMSMSLAVAVEALLFCFHLHGRSHLDIHVHTLLIVSVLALFASVVIEWTHRHNMLSILFRAMCALVQGSWFYTVGFILYPPFSSHLEESHDDHNKMMLLTSLFCWQIAASIVFIIFVGFCFHLKYRPLLRNTERNENYLFDTYSDATHIKQRNGSKREILIDSNRISTALSGDDLKYSVISTSDEDN